MKIQSVCSILFACSLILMESCKELDYRGNYQREQSVQSFSLENVKLKEGPFLNATLLNEKSLINYEPDRFLARFRIQAGLELKAEPYGGWESESLAGHSLGHYLSAISLMFQSTGNTIFKERSEYIINELFEIQQANGGEYLAAFDNGREIFEKEIKEGIITAQPFYLNGIWAPFYTFHKVMAGLRDTYRIFGNEKALEISRGMGNWIGYVVLPMKKKEVQEMLNCEFGGIQEVLLDLREDTGEEKYLDIARAFHHEAIIDPLILGVDILPGIHGNTQIPKLIASSRMYEITSDEDYRSAAENFWDIVVHNHSYVTGGHGNHEYFGKPDQLSNRLSDETTETCNVYNMLKLSRNLFQWEPRAEIADFYERALFNHILSAQHPVDGKVIYNLSLEMGGYKRYQNPFGFTCCVGTGMETHSKHGANIYFHNDKELFINQFISSELNWEDRKMKLRQITAFPEEQKSCFIMELEEPQEFSLHIRYPHWAQMGMKVSVNGWEQENTKEPESYVTINRKWIDGDTVKIDFPFNLRTESMPDDENRVAFFYGPVLLAGILGKIDDPLANTEDFVPVLITEESKLENWLLPVDSTSISFQSINVGVPRDISLIPFYKTHDVRYSVYFDLFTPEKLVERNQKIKEEAAKLALLDSITFDSFQPGDSLEELDHKLTGEKLNIRRNFKGRKARGTEREGWLSFEIGVDSDISMKLVFEYWGGFTGSKTFDILVNDERIATQNISGLKDGHFINVEYDIPNNLKEDTDHIIVKLMPHPGSRSGPFFFARTIPNQVL